MKIANVYRTADSDILIRVALVVTRAIRQTAAPVGGCIDLEATDQEVHNAICASHETLPLAERQVIHCAERPYVLPIEIVRAVLHALVDVIVVAVVVEALGPSVVGQDRQPIAEPLVNLRLE